MLIRAEDRAVYNVDFIVKYEVVERQGSWNVDAHFSTLAINSSASRFTSRLKETVVLATRDSEAEAHAVLGKILHSNGRSVDLVTLSAQAEGEIPGTTGHTTFPGT
jgi:hypothetical protein